MERIGSSGVCKEESHAPKNKSDENGVMEEVESALQGDEKPSHGGLLSAGP